MGNFASPKTINQLINELKSKDDNTYIVAGGTDLAVKINNEKIFDYKLIDISSVTELRNIEETDTEIIIGASVTMTEIENSEILQKNVNALVKSAISIGSTQIRNRATIGGNVCNSSQSADTMGVLFAFNAYCEIVNSKGEFHKEKLEHVIIGLEKNNLKKDEVLTKIIVVKKCCVSGFAKIGARKAVTISKINCCAKLELDNENNIISATVFLGAVGPKPIKALNMEIALQNRKLTTKTAYKIKDIIMGEVESAIPTRASRHYKKHAVIGVVEDALLLCLDEQKKKEVN